MTISSKTALVTGASSGLGSEFARQLAANGFDLVITARREQRLRTLADELHARYGVQVEVIPADLTQPEQVSRLEEYIQSADHLDLLINNAGFGLYDYFTKLDRQAQLDMIRVHITASVSLAHAALPGMISRHSGGLVQVASMAAFLPGRKSVLYSATKSFLVNFSQSLQAELSGSGVHVQALCPGFTITEYHDQVPQDGFDRRRIPRWLWLKSSAVVSYSLHEIARGSGVAIPGFWYQLGGFFLHSVLIGGLIRKLA